MIRLLELTPSHDLAHWPKLVEVKHPGYERRKVTLLSLPAYPQSATPADGDTLYGVVQCLVLDACRILTNFAASIQDDYLACDRAGLRRVPASDVFLVPGEYYYHLNAGPATEYPIVTEFAAFVFPDTIPPHWSRYRSEQETADLGRRCAGLSASAMSDRVRAEDLYCVVTKHYNVCGNAHIVPKDQKAWFNGNDMGRYNRISPTTSVDDVANGMTLRCDVHRLLNRHAFVFYPAGDRKFVTYIVLQDTFDYAYLLHGRVVTIPLRVSDEFLYARFAYNVINLPRLTNASTNIFSISEAVRQEQEASGLLNDTSSSKTPSSKAAMSDVSADNYTLQDECDIEALSSGPQSVENSDSGEGPERYKTKFALWFPELAKLPEVDDPPETLRTTFHPETPHMLQLMSEYIKKHPEVWQTSTTPATATRPDTEGYYAERLIK
ncbi:hypothetical protein BD311DRAFT_791061 [Dichomitus squalens]|uniref:HNH nuclease domain-containing protein n=1 Tax=Dichomitus squalens TaxID=114155 RepID=A0A4V2JZA9_9APHY|nr:hypothetical protein BD311DRAFT_791061 [Dichomitus squalens]